MNYINPISGAALPAALAQEQLAVDKSRQVRRQQAAERNVAAMADRFEHTVENAEAVAPVHEDLNRQPPPRKKSGQHGDDPGEADGGGNGGQEPPHIDVIG